jgi:hypothetical protein
MNIAEVRSLSALREALDHMVSEARAEDDEHEEHVAEAKRRLQNLQKLRAALDKPPATEPRR